jgi:hypothetical protein
VASIAVVLKAQGSRLLVVGLLITGSATGCRPNSGAQVVAPPQQSAPIVAPLPVPDRGLILRGADKEPAVLSVLVEDWYWIRIDLVLAAWADGEVVWSADHLRGGPPYFTAHLDQTVLRSSVQDIQRFLQEQSDTLAENGHLEHEPMLVVGTELDGQWCQAGSNRTPFNQALDDTPRGQSRRKAWKSLLALIGDLVPESGQSKDTSLVRAKFGVQYPDDYPLAKPWPH